MKDLAGQRTTYYSLAKDRLKGKHPRVYNLILVLVLLWMTGAAAFLLSDIVSFGLESSSRGIINGGVLQDSVGSSMPAVSQIDIDEKGEVRDNTVLKKDPPEDSLLANTSPNEGIPGEPASNSSSADGSGKFGGNLNSSGSTQTVLSSSQDIAIRSITSEKKGAATSSSGKHHSSSSSKSPAKNISEEKSISENSTSTNTSINTSINKNTGTNINKSTDSTAAIGRSINLHPKGQSSIGAYRNASPQNIKGIKHKSQTEGISIEAEAGQSKENPSRADPERSIVLQESSTMKQSALTDSLAFSYLEADRPIFKTSSSVKIDLSAEEAIDTNCRSCIEGTPIKSETAEKIKTIKEAEKTEKSNTATQTGTTEKTETIGQIDARANTATTVDTDRPENTYPSKAIETIKTIQTADSAEGSEEGEPAAEYKTSVGAEGLAENDDLQKDSTAKIGDYSEPLKLPDRPAASSPAESPATALEDKSDKYAIAATTATSSLLPIEQSRIEKSGLAEAASSAQSAKSFRLQEKRSEQIAKREKAREENNAERNVERIAEGNVKSNAESNVEVNDVASSTKPTELSSTTGCNDNAVSAPALPPASREEDGSNTGSGLQSSRSVSQAIDERNRAESALRTVSSISRDQAQAQAQKERKEAVERARSSVYVKTKELQNSRSLQIAEKESARIEHNNAAVVSKKSASVSRENRAEEYRDSREKAMYVKNNELQLRRSNS